jgi:hypothetical protein
MLRSLLALSLAVFSFGCASSSEAQKPTDAAADGAQHAVVHKPALGGDAKAFHDVLSPLWHATPSPERTANTCAAAPQMSQIAATMTTSTPANAKEGYADKATALAAATAKLEKVCATPDRAAFEATFHSLHEAFHGVAETCGD